MRSIRLILFTLLTVLLLSSVALAGQDVTFAWDPYTGDPITGFKLYMAGAPGVAVTPDNLVATIPGATVTTYKQLNVPPGTHYWVLTAYATGMESDASNEVSYAVKLKPPSGLGSKVTVSLGNVTVTVAAK